MQAYNRRREEAALKERHAELKRQAKERAKAKAAARRREKALARQNKVCVCVCVCVRRPMACFRYLCVFVYVQYI